MVLVGAWAGITQRAKTGKGGKGESRQSRLPSLQERRKKSVGSLWRSPIDCELMIKGSRVGGAPLIGGE